VEAGTYEVGAVNEKSGWRVGQRVDLDKVEVLAIAYYDYHWVIHPDVKQQHGEGFALKVQNAFLRLDSRVPEQRKFSNF